jgi:mannitol/fructose-specific phosphotransferase system IIA component (Ntr-type)
MSDLERYLSADRVRVGVEAPGRGDVLAELARLLGGTDAATREAVREDLIRREQMGSTGVGGGIAFPHARVASLPGLRMAVVRTARPIDYAAMDGRPVDLFVAIAGPESARREYLSVLGTLSWLFRTDRVRDDLRRADTPGEIVEMIRRLSGEAARAV